MQVYPEFIPINIEKPYYILLDQKYKTSTSKIYLHMLRNHFLAYVADVLAFIFRGIIHA